MKARRLILAGAFALWLLANGAAGQRLPVRVYRSADGLGSSTVNSIRRDSRGFLWFCTRDGLSRFDGLEFKTYHLEKPTSPYITEIFERRNGDYLVVPQGGGVYRFNAETPVVETELRSNYSPFVIKAERVLNANVGHITEDADGNLWAVSGGLARLRDGDDGKLTIERVPLTIPGTNEQPERVNELIRARDKSLWITTNRGLLRLFPDGRKAFYETEKDTPLQRFLVSVFEDRDGLIWLGTQRGVVVLKPELIPEGASFVFRKLNSRPAAGGALPEAAGEAIEFTVADNLHSKPVSGFNQFSDKRVWMISADGVTIYERGRIYKFDSSHGFGADLNDILEDENGSVWIVGGSGVYKTSVGAFSSYGAAEGLPDLTVHSIYEDAGGQIYVVNGDWLVSRLDARGDKNYFTSARPAVVAAESGEPSWTSTAAFLDSQNSWWFLTSQKLFRFDNVAPLENLARAAPSAVYHAKDFRGGAFYRMWEDSGGDVWISNRSANSNQNALTRWRRAAGEFHTFSQAENYPVERAASAFAEDAGKNLWFGFYYGGLARFRDGRFQLFTTADGLPQGFVTALYLDRAKRLWIATSEGGIGLIKDAGADRPQFVHYTIAEGLASNNVRALIEDAAGEIYAGTVRGVDRIEPETGRIKHFTTEDGLPDDFALYALRKKSGELWFGTRGGAARIEPRADRQSLPAPPIMIGGLRVAGNKQPISELGQTEVALPEFNHWENNLQIDFFSINFAPGDQIRYQYQLEGASNGDWSKPTAERAVTFANLAPGDYKFIVRAVNADGLTSRHPAFVKFTILSPVWARWWFIVLCCAFAVAVFLTLERHRAARRKERRTAAENLEKVRLEKMRELEQVRKRIAADLHDDIGSSLTQISILSEVLRRNNGDKRDGNDADTLNLIAASSRELVDAMSDIVWAINPQKDHLSDLTGKMRRFAADSFSPRRIKFTFDAPDLTADLPLGANLRRELFLIFKEAVNNIVKHAAARSVEIVFNIENDEMRLTVSDDGTGFDSARQNGGGHGLPSMKERAASLGGSLRLNSSDGAGTTIEILVPVNAIAAATEEAT